MVLKNWRSMGEKALSSLTLALLIMIGTPLCLFNIIPINIAFDAAIQDPTVFGVFGFLMVLPVILIFKAMNDYRKRDIEFMIVRVEPKKAVQVVENSLDNKNLPYVRSRQKFQLKTEGLLIQVKQQHLGGYSLNSIGSKILIGPVSGHNLEIANSLKSKIADGFQLKGLT